MKLTRRTFLEITGVAALTATGCAGAVSSDDASADARTDATRDSASRDALGPDAPTPDVAMDAISTDDASLNDAAPDAGSVPDFSSIDEAPTVFPLGVASGDALPTGAMVWTRYTGPETIVLRVLEMRGDVPVRVAYEAEVRPASGGYTHVDVPGLSSGTWYRFAFLVRGGAGTFTGRSPVGRFRTAIAPDALEAVTFAGVSCTHQRARPFPALSHAGSRNDLDFFVHNGDMVYCDGATTLADYRAKYAENWTSEGFQALFRSTGLYTTWDDHEVDNDWNPENTPAAKIAAAKAAYFEHRPQRRDPAARDRIWRSFRWGQALELFLLDCRGERRPSTRSTPMAQYISREQMDWLKAGLARSTALFKFVVNSVPITNFPSVWDAAASDRWEGYAAQRNEILDFIVSMGLRNVWWLSGDFHVGVLGKVEPSGPLSAMREVLMGPNNTPNPLSWSLTGSQWEFVTREHNYTVFRVDPVARTLDVTYVDAMGTTMFSRRYGAS